MWGGATFDTAMRFLKEDPWQRLAELRERIPNILFQMLLRANNAVGYTNYPDNVVQAFVKESAQAGIDLFRIFDALNWLPNLQLAIEAVRETGMLCEAAICYTGDILDPEPHEVQPEVLRRPGQGTGEAGGEHPGHQGHGRPVQALRGRSCWCSTLQAGDRHPDPLPHARHAPAARSASLLMAAEEGVDIVDAAMAPLSGMTSQPNLNSLVEALRFTERDTGLDFDALQATADYWEAVREYYLPVRERPAGRQRRRLPPRDAGRPVHQPATSRRRRSGWRAAGTRSAACTPRSTSCSATSSR